MGSDNSKGSRRKVGILGELRAILSGTPRCAYCGKPITGKPYVWRGKKFCSRECKRKYREELAKRKRKNKGIRLPKDTFEAIYWRRS